VSAALPFTWVEQTKAQKKIDWKLFLKTVNTGTAFIEIINPVVCAALNKSTQSYMVWGRIDVF